MIITIGSIKGGVGKSTIATNLTVLRSQSASTLLIDADSQHTSLDWLNQRDLERYPAGWTTIQMSGPNIHIEVDKLKKHYDTIIIDVGGRDTKEQRSAIACADIFLTPFKPRSAELWTFDQLLEMFRQIKYFKPNLNCYTVMNFADILGKDNTQAQEYLATVEDLCCIPYFICQRKAFPNAFCDGLAVHELKKQDEKATTEMKNVYEFIFGGKK